MAALLLVRVSVLLAIALAAGRLFRRASGRTRHAVWTAAFAAMLVLPALPYVLPAVDVPIPERWRSASPGSSSNPEVVPATPLPVNVHAQSVRDESVVLPAARTTRPLQTARWFVNIQPRLLLIIAWAFGTCVALALLGVSLLRVRALDRSARPCTDEEWERAAASIAARAGAMMPRLRFSNRIDTPMAGGLTRPTIYLPASAARWPAERRDIVLAHELAHLARRDPLRHIAARAAVALYWFHPLAWVAAADASIAREQACDEAVLALGTRPSSYAQVLLDFAESQASPLRSLAALPIVERSLLEHRLMAILAHDSGMSRPRPLIAAFTIAMVALALGAARPSAAVRSSQLAVSRSQTTGTLSCNIDPRGWLQKSYSISTAGGERVVNYDMIGTSDAGRVILKSFKDLQVCMVAQGAAGDDERLQPSEWTRRAQQTIIEARRGNRVQRLELTREGGGQRVSWTIDGKEQPFDSAAQDWRERMLAVLDTTWEISRLHGEVSTLRGEISSLRGQESSLQGEISTLRGQVSSLRGQISSVHGDESSLRGEISSIQGHVSSLQGLISSEQGSISSLEATRSFASDAERERIATRVREHEAEIARVEKAIRDYNAEAKIAEVERRLRDLNVQNQVEAIESQIRSLSTDGKIAEIEKRIRDLDVEGKSRGIENQIDALNAETRTRALEGRRDQELKDLLAAIARIR